MSEAGNKINIDVGDVLKRGSNEVGMAELNKMGLKKVKVIRHSQVQELISQAVENAISRFIFGAEGRKEHERLMSLITEKESALSDVSGAERSELKSEVETLKRQMQDQAKRLEEAKAKVIEETKKEYEALAEKTSLENQLVMQKKVELELHGQLQEMTMLMGQLKEKIRLGESQQNQNVMKFQDLEKIPILEEEIGNLETEVENLQKEIEENKTKVDAEKQKNQMAAKAIGEKLKQTEELNSKILKLEEEKRKNESEQSALKELIREKDFSIKEAQSKLDRMKSEKDELLQTTKSSHLGLDSELKKAFSEKELAHQKVSQLESSNNSLKDQLREKEFSLREMQLKVEHLQSEKDQSARHGAQLESQIVALNASNLEAKLISEKLTLKEESAREKLEELKNNVAVANSEKEKVLASLHVAQGEIENLQNTISELTQQLTEKSSEDKNAAMMEAIKAMMSDMKGDISEQISKVKLRAGSGGGGGGNNDNYVELDPAVILKNMFAEKVESNFGKVALDSRKTAGKKDFGKTLDALKSLNKDKKEE